MKYVRTKDGIFKVKKISATHLETEVTKRFVLANVNGEIIETYDLYTLWIGKKHWKEKIIAKADTIEELCDEFVYEYQTGVRVINKKIIAMPDIVKTYGAIWTDWGLKYVAKMNEKGDFELL